MNNGRKVGKQYSSLHTQSRYATRKQLRERTARRQAAQSRYEAAVARWAADNA